MLSCVFVRASVIARLKQNPLGPYLEQLATRLHEQGYAGSQIQACLRAGDKFGRWLQQQGDPVTPIDDALLRRYVNGLRRYRHGRQCKAAVGLTHLFRLLREHGLITPSPKPASPVDQWLMRYNNYLKEVLGAADKTCENYGAIVRRFANDYCRSSEPYWTNVAASQIAAFVQREAATRQRSGRKQPSAAVRSFLRFLVFEGEINSGLEAAAPIPPQWAQTSLPVRLMPDEVERVVAVYREEATVHPRNYAIVMLLARLGLRASEVIALRLDDIDWFESRVLIRPGKTRQERCLPLPHDVGNALAAYLQHARPTSRHRRIFLHDRAPYSPLTTAANVRWIVVQALQHAGIVKRPRIGSHLFRHTAASQMLNNGASFKDIADVLGHRCLETTGVYAKLELDILASVALPWQGGES